MTTTTIRSLSTLVDMRSNEVDKLQSEMAAKESVRERYQKTLDKLTSLYESSGPSGRLPMALALNCGDYKQGVMAMADSQRLNLHMHEADMAVSQRALTAAFVKREVLGQVLERHQDAAATAQRAQERKRHDELATQLWYRGHK
ncbi:MULTISPECIES: flagellar export protein FliJ [unclassified Duganella]|uniref:flagellar export protein FliJ n=1 Tax=unclassified Duganella TaxID=2636909 RepID=UPI0006F5BDA9|nr:MULTISPECIES: flagellar export protein FliJ [unclassified Duganella]KQV61704.1 flagellar export protein FliJ [Duganella sp. Root336D2]KRB84210.1 flagellar export protein FliJ [Duganella sp. Root198D2]